MSCQGLSGLIVESPMNLQGIFTDLSATGWTRDCYSKCLGNSYIRYFMICCDQATVWWCLMNCCTKNWDKRSTSQKPYFCSLKSDPFKANKTIKTRTRTLLRMLRLLDFWGRTHPPVRPWLPPSNPVAGCRSLDCSPQTACLHPE